MDYKLLDSGFETKLERFGDFTLIRPCPQALWRKNHPDLWKSVDATFTREGGWHFARKLPREWTCRIGGVLCKVSPTDFGHVGVFPEHAALWDELRPLVRGGQVLNLFAYSGGATLGFAQEGARLCHLDASKGMVEWARENAALNNLTSAPIRWIIDDALKFLKREERREVRYDGVLLDPPTFGRGAQGEVFKIERDLGPLLELCRAVLSKNPRFLVMSCHTPGMTPTVLRHIAAQLFPKACLEVGEMAICSEGALEIPSGTFVKVLF